MARYRKILVAFDGSKASRNALALASHLARVEKSWIKVVAVVPAYVGDLELIGVENITEAIKGPGKELLAEAMKIAEAEDVHILTDLEQGEPYEKIVHVADEENCDLIVMGRRGLSALERELMGSVTSRVIGHTTRNVMVVPEESGLNTTKILLATDGSDNSSAAVSHAIDLARDKSAELTIVSVVYTNDEFLALAPAMLHDMTTKARKTVEALGQRAEQEGVKVTTLVKEGEPHEAINSLAAERGADLIIMGSHGRKGLRRLLMGSVTERTIGYASCPVLVVH